ncbi:hypothetical protein FQN54_004136 [Arachnomyces sp. PD_36]|nr:hypothetical protein FQN54_004136 [Arachnomyces sp. PD_36]
MDFQNLPVDIHYLILEQLVLIEDYGVHQEICAPVLGKRDCQSWTNIVQYQQVCRLWRDCLKTLLPKYAPVSIMIHHAPDSLAIKATKFFLEKDGRTRSSSLEYRPWYYEEKVLVNALYRQSAECLRLLLPADLPRVLKTRMKGYFKNLPHIAADLGQTSALKLLHHHGVPLDSVIHDDRFRPVDRAVMKNRMDAMMYLFMTYPHVLVFQEFPMRTWPIEHVAKCGTIPMMRALLKLPSAFSDRARYKRRSLLDRSLLGLNFEMTIYLLNKRHKAKIAHTWYRSINLALEVAPLHVIRRMIEVRKECDLPHDIWGFEGRDIALRRGDHKIMDLLVESDPDGPHRAADRIRRRSILTRMWNDIRHPPEYTIVCNAPGLGSDGLFHR